MGARTGAAELYRRYGEDGLGSLAGARLAAARWRARWSVETAEAFPPTAVLQSGDRFLVEGGEWILLDARGTALARARAGAAPIVLDPGHGLFYSTRADGMFAAARIADGAQAFLYPPYLGETYSRTCIVRSGQRLVVAGVHRPLDPHGAGEPSDALIEAIDLPERIETTSLGVLRGSRSAGKLFFPGPVFLAAPHRDRLVCAARDRIYEVGLDLKVLRVIEGDFDPRAISVDEGGRIYLVADRGGATWLWRIDAEGVYDLAYELAPGTTPVAPPVIGADHGITLLLPDRVLSIATDGKTRWSRPTRGALAGGIATADGSLVIADGPDVVALDAAGEARVLVSVPGAIFVTAPTLTARGELLAGTDGKVYCFEPEPASR